MFDPRKMKQLMKQMDMKEIAATEAIIRTRDGDLVIQNPKVTRMNMMGQETYQIVGHAEKRSGGETTISEEDVQMVQEQAGVSEEEARKALEEADGDIAAAILALKS